MSGTGRRLSATFGATHLGLSSLRVRLSRPSKALRGSYHLFVQRCRPLHVGPDRNDTSPLGQLAPLVRARLLVFSEEGFLKDHTTTSGVGDVRQ